MTLLGMIHLAPLPASPRPSPGFAAIRDQAMRDAEAIAAGGMDGLIIENFGDAPFTPDANDPHVTAFLAILASDIRRAWPGLTVGLNLLRNDARGALGAAAAAGADLIRVNVHTGAMLTDQGVIQGAAHRTLRYRQELGADGARVRIAADVLVKHAQPLAPVRIAPHGAGSIGALAADTFYRGGADVLILTGQGTGHAADPDRFRAVREAVPEAPLWLGSGLSAGNAAEWRPLIAAGLLNGAIIGTALHRDGRIDAPVEAERARAVCAALRGA